jgi:hypothetical protein
MLGLRRLLRPGKHSHPDQTVLSVATILLQQLRRSKLDSYEGLRAMIRRRVRGGELLFLPALDLLFLLGLIEYRPKTDVVEFVGTNETV